MLRILHVVASLETGGLERLVHDMVVARGSSTSVACLESIGPFGEALADRGFPVALIGRRGVLQTVLRLRHHLLDVQPDVIHCHNLAPFMIGAWAARLAGGIPVVMTKHGALLPETGMARWVIRVLLHRAYAVGVSGEAVDLMREWMFPGSRRVRLIANGISIEPFADLPARDVARRRLGLQPESFVVGIVARIAQCKGHLVLLEAFARLLARRADAVLLIVGDGPTLPAVQERLRELKLTRSVRLLGERRDVPSILAAMDVFCLPSAMEGMPMTILEAMAAELPVIASNVGGIPGMVDHGRTGLLVSPQSVEALADAMDELAADPGRAHAMGRAGRCKLDRSFGLDQTVAAYAQCYVEALGNRAGTPLERPALR